MSRHNYYLSPMREILRPREVSDLQKAYDELLDLGVRLQAEYSESHDDTSAAWETVINDLLRRRTVLLRSLEPRLSLSVGLAQAVQDVTDAFTQLPTRPISASQVVDDNVSRSFHSLLPAAKECGYDATVSDNKLSLRKGDVVIELGFMERDGEVGLGPRGAVRYLEAHSGGEFVVQYNGTWEGVASDKGLQREVDRAIAIFG